MNIIKWIRGGGENSAAVRRREGSGRTGALGRLFGRGSAAAAVGVPPGALGKIVIPAARERWLMPQAAAMTPARIEAVLRAGLAGESPEAEHALYTLMERTWPRLAKNIQEVKNAVAALEWNVLDAEDADPAHGDLLRLVQHGMRGDPCGTGLGWNGMLRALMDGWFRGAAVAEIDWEPRGGAVLPRQARPAPPWAWGWRADDGRLMLHPDPDAPAEWEEMPADKFLVAVRNCAGGHPSGGALLRPLAWWWCAANFSSEWLLNFAQLFGQPLRKATYAPGSEGAKDALEDAMEAMGAAPWIVHPEGTTVDLVESSRGGNDNPQAAVLDRADRMADLLVLGQTLTSDVGDSGSLALGDVHQAVRGDVIDAAAGWLAEVLNEQLAPAAARLSFGGGAAEPARPFGAWWQPGRKEAKNTREIAETVKLLVEAGVPLKRDYVYDILDMPEPGEGEELKPETRNQRQERTGEAPPREDEAALMGRALAGMPFDARQYYLGRLRRETRNQRPETRPDRDCEAAAGK